MSLHKLVTQTSENDPRKDYTKPLEGLRAALLDHLQELENELETTAENISGQAVEHVHSSELILTLGHSKCVESFLKTAAKQRKIEVIVAECAPACRVGERRLAVNPTLVSEGTSVCDLLGMVLFLLGETKRCSFYAPVVRVPLGYWGDLCK